MRVLFSQGIIAISKPRCGSTSLRRMLGPLVDPAKGDISVDVAGQRPPYHPHHPAPYLRKLLEEDGYDLSGMTTIILTRHPVEMLWSYHKFFKPDMASRYNYAPNWDADHPMEFARWIAEGAVGMNPEAKALAPEWISTRDLSPLSLEAHVMSRTEGKMVDRVFRLEALDELQEWLEERLGRRLRMVHVNRSAEGQAPRLSAGNMERVRSMFPMESEMYGL